MYGGLKQDLDACTKKSGLFPIFFSCKKDRDRGRIKMMVKYEMNAGEIISGLSG